MKKHAAFLATLLGLAAWCGSRDPWRTSKRYRKSRRSGLAPRLSMRRMPAS